MKIKEKEAHKFNYLKNKICCGIYFLTNNDDVVYIGQSINVSFRVKTHLKENKKEFCDVYIIECCKEKLNELENHFIVKYNPKYNKILNNSDVNCNYFIERFNILIGYSPFTKKMINKIIEISNFEKKMYNKNYYISKEDANVLIDYIIKKYFEILNNFEKVK